MRSLTVKLTLAFLLVGVTGVALVALLVGVRTRDAFSRFLSERDQATLVEALGNYYAARGSWDGVGAMLDRTPPLDLYSRGIVLADAGGRVVLGSPRYPAGSVLAAVTLNSGTPVSAGGQRVGTVLLLAAPGPPGNGRPPPDARFLERVTWATVVSAGVAALIALLLGVLLARSLTRPLRELTGATEAMARGALGYRVSVRSRDEIGELAAAFNQMSADLAHASQLRKQMTADLAHDLRTPLSVLRGYTEGLQDGRLQGSPAIYATMHGEVEHLQRLVEDLRTLSLADAHELPLNRRAVDPAALLERAVLAHIVQAVQRGVALRVDAAEDLPSVQVDTDRMAQVMNNLVANALRHTPAGGEIVLSAARDDRPAIADRRRMSAEAREPGSPCARSDAPLPIARTHTLPHLAAPSADAQAAPLADRPPTVILRVRDTGDGIAPADLPHVFERFYRGDKARQRGDEGSSGLGLAIARAIVEAHGGAIGVESAPGVGTTFTIHLPGAVPAALGLERSAPPPAALRS
jgi:two-component system sensor histidine kinase BaeS